MKRMEKTGFAMKKFFEWGQGNVGIACRRIIMRDKVKTIMESQRQTVWQEVRD